MMKKCSIVLVLISIILVCNISPSKCEENKDSITKASVPTQIYRCITRFNLLRCLKYLVLLRMETRDISFEPTNSTLANEFLGSILRNVQNLPQEIPENITKLNDEELNERLTMGFQKLFFDRPIKLHFIPNMLVKIVPAKGNDLEINLKKIVESVSGRSSTSDSAAEVTSNESENEDYDENYDDEKTDETKTEVVEGDKKDDLEKGGMGMRKKRGYYLQMGIPLLLAPYMVFAGFLPMLIPVLKLATAFTTIVNVTALIASIMYLARQHALEKEMQQTIYFNPGYKERK